MSSLLAFDIGNTNIVLGVFEDERLVFEMRMKSDPGRTVDEYEAILVTLFERRLGPGRKFDSCIISSVVPPLTPNIVRLVEDRFGLSPIIVGPGIKTGLSIKTADPASVGADRIVNAVAVKDLYGLPAIAIDFGTATSLDYVSAAGNYEGGVIAPGPAVAMESLVRSTAKLPRIEMLWPKSVVGKSTVGAMQAGSVIGYVCMVDGLIRRIIQEVGEVQHVVATGGLGRLYADHSECIKCYEPHLTMIGLRIIARMNV